MTQVNQINEEIIKKQSELINYLKEVISEQKELINFYQHKNVK